jgi:hypothetical protein
MKSSDGQHTIGSSSGYARQSSSTTAASANEYSSVLDICFAWSYESERASERVNVVLVVAHMCHINNALRTTYAYLLGQTEEGPLKQIGISFALGTLDMSCKLLYNCTYLRSAGRDLCRSAVADAFDIALLWMLPLRKLVAFAFDQCQRLGIDCSGIPSVRARGTRRSNHRSNRGFFQRRLG